ncbi:MAG: DNA-binding protein [Planctomycetaceae bacterium]|nr:MAG: DNA-binding protein [Planctomycetaceae bacterium]
MLLSSQPRLLDRNSLADRLGVSLATIERLTRFGKISVIRVGSRCLYDADQVVAELATGRGSERKGRGPKTAPSTRMNRPLSLHDMAELLGVSDACLAEHAATGELPSQPNGKELQFDPLETIHAACDLAEFPLSKEKRKSLRVMLVAELAGRVDGTTGEGIERERSGVVQ